MSTLTGGFDAVMQLRGDALARVAREMHVVGSVTHADSTIHADHFVTTQLGAPVVGLSPPSASGDLELTATTRALCRVRPLDDATALGGSAVATIVARGRVVLPPGDPAPITRDGVLSVDWAQTTTADVTVLGASDPQTSALVADALAAATAGARAGIYNVGILSEAGISSAALASTPSGTGAAAPTLSIALNLFGASGARAGIADFVDGDWALALSGELVLGRVREGLQRQLGALPPPAGPAAVRVGEEQVCLLPTPLGCGLWGTAVTWLDELAFVLTANGLELSGSLRREILGMPAATVTAVWSTTVALSVASDGSLHAAASSPSVTVPSLVGQLANFLSSGALETAARDAIANVLVAGLGTTDPTRLLALMLAELGSAGRTVGASADPRPVGVECRPEGILVHGALTAGPAAPGPHAELAVIGTPDAGRVLLAASASWAPGGDVESVDWDFGDGATASTGGDGCALVVEHTYAPGAYTAQVAITDGAGGSATAALAIEPGRLALRHVLTDRVHQVEWEQCGDAADPVHVRFAVTTCGAALAGVDVSAAGAGWSISAVTDGTGQAELDLDVSQVRNHPAPGTLPPFGIGAVTVTASSAGFQPASERLTLLDCGALFATIDAARRAREEALDRLAGYAALRDLRARPLPGRSLGDLLAPLGTETDPRPRPPVSDPLLRSATEARAQVAALLAITDVIEFGGGPAVAARLLGIQTRQVPGHLAKLWSGVTEDAAAIEAALVEGAPAGGGRPGDLRRR